MGPPLDKIGVLAELQRCRLFKLIGDRLVTVLLSAGLARGLTPLTFVAKYKYLLVGTITSGVALDLVVSVAQIYYILRQEGGFLKYVKGCSNKSYFMLT